MSQPWNPRQYGLFRAERTAPFRDLVAMVEAERVRRAVDLGCGTGRLTAELHEAVRADRTLGIDSSPAMLGDADRTADDGLELREQTIEDFASGRGADFDLVFSNAALHWVRGHPDLLRRLAGRLTPKGQLALQVPAMDRRPAHSCARAVAETEPFAAALGEPPYESPVLEPAEYAVLLREIGFTRQRVILGVYGHELPSGNAVVEWMRGSLLTWYEKRLDPELFERFVEAYRGRVLRELGAHAERPFFLAYERILVWATR